MTTAMLKELGFTEARARLSELFDLVINEYSPAVVTRRRQDVVLLRRDLLQSSVLGKYRLTVESVREPDGSWTLSVDGLGIVVNAGNLGVARTELVGDLRQYAEDYMNRLPLFLNAPNRRSHLPYVLRIALARDSNEIAQMLES